MFCFTPVKKPVGGRSPRYTVLLILRGRVKPSVWFDEPGASGQYLTVNKYVRPGYCDRGRYSRWQMRGDAVELNPGQQAAFKWLHGLLLVIRIIPSRAVRQNRLNIVIFLYFPAGKLRRTAARRQGIWRYCNLFNSVWRVIFCGNQWLMYLKCLMYWTSVRTSVTIPITVGATDVVQVLRIHKQFIHINNN